jgi:hypothetical protein
MASVILNPTNIPEAVSTGYQRQNILIFASMVGFCNINMSTSGVISAGSIVEINGTLVRSYANESVLGINSIASNSIFFIYAVPISNTEIQYQASATIPTWHTEKCGYYTNDNNRAVIRASKDSAGNVYGVTKMSDILYSDIPPNSGGSLVFTGNSRAHVRFEFNAGWYRYEIASGLGSGNGGNGATGSSSAAAGGGGGVSWASYTRSAVFWHLGGEIIIHVGGNGYNGANGNNAVSDAGAGGGSGSGAGEETYIKVGAAIFSTGEVKSGRGGNGGASRNNTRAGGHGNYFGLSGESGQSHSVTYTGSDSSYTVTAAGGPGGVGFPNPDYGFGGGGGGGAGYVQDSTSTGTRPGADGASISTNPNGIFSSPGWLREYGDSAAGYCNIYALS